MLVTKRRPVPVGEILVEEFMHPLRLTQAALAEAMGVPRKHVNELCNGKRAVTAPTALILARVFGNTPDFWLNVQRRNDLWEALPNPREGDFVLKDYVFASGETLPELKLHYTTLGTPHRNAAGEIDNAVLLLH